MRICNAGRQFAEEMVIGIEDVTDRAAKLREAVKGTPDNVDDEGRLRMLDSKERWERKWKTKEEKFTVKQLVEMGMVPLEVEYVMDEEVRAHLKMDGGADS